MVFFAVEYYGEVLFLKEKLGASLGMFGVILWELVLFVICFMPFMILGFPFWIAVIVVILMNVLPVLGGAVSLGLYIWAFIVALKMPSSALVIAFYVCFALYVIVAVYKLLIVNLGR